MNRKSHQKFKLLKFIIGFLAVLAIVTVVYQNFRYRARVVDKLSFIEKKIGPFEPSLGNSYGSIYSLDGVPMLQGIDLETGEELRDEEKMPPVRLYSATQSYFAPAIGYSYQNDMTAESQSWGFLREENVQEMLLSNLRFSNRESRRGDSIVTTIYSPAQEEAMAQLEELSPVSGTGSIRGSIAVVNQDGAILVNAATLPDESMMFQHMAKKYGRDRDYPIYYGANHNAFSPVLVGSSFKPLTARILEQSDHLLPRNWSVYYSEFDDYSDITIDGIRVSNWEVLSMVDAEQYYTASDGNRYHRSSNLSSALINSSNTYFLSHANELGLDKYKRLLNDKLHLYDHYDTGGGVMNGLEVYQKEKFQSVDAYTVNLPFGSSAKLSPVRLASAYNHILGGAFYFPFDIAQIRDPKGELIFEQKPKEHDDYKLPISVSDDILVKGMSDTFQSYLESEDSHSRLVFEEFSDELLQSGRILAKSGTVGLDAEHENRTLALTLLNKERTAVVCTAVITLEGVPNNSVPTSSLVYKLLCTLEKLGVY